MELKNEIDKNSSSYWKLCEGLMGAEIKGIEFHKNHLLGDSSDSINIDSPLSFQQTSKDIYCVPLLLDGIDRQPLWQGQLQLGTFTVRRV